MLYGGATGHHFALTCPKNSKNRSARLFKRVEMDMTQYYAINLPRQMSNKSTTGGNPLRKGGNPPQGATLRGATILLCGGDMEGLREILNFENRFSKCQFFLV